MRTKYQSESENSYENNENHDSRLSLFINDDKDKNENNPEPDTESATVPVNKRKGKLKSMNLFTLGRTLNDENKTIDFLQELNLLPKSANCPTCKNILAKLYCIKRVKHERNHYLFQCNRRKCKNKGQNQVPLRKGSWFEGGKLSLRKTVLLIYCFINKFSYKSAVQESSVSSAEETENEEVQPLKRRKLETSEETVADYYNYCREICAEIVRREQSENKIDGNNCIVEIDEAKFGKRKYNRGRVVDGNWVLGGICRENKQVFLQVVGKRDKQTLLPIIEKYVEKGKTIMTDCWASYKDLEKMG